MEATSVMKKWIKDNIDLTIYRDYRDDSFDPEVIGEIMEHIREKIEKGSTENPVDLLKDELYELLHFVYGTALPLQEDAADRLAKEFNLDFGEAYDIIVEETSVTYPIEDYLKDKYNTVIKMDTGDSDYEFACNSIEPAYYGDPVEDIKDESAVLWLAKENGYSKENFISCMQAKAEGHLSMDETFIHSLHQELENTSFNCNMVVFLGQMSLEEMAIAQKEGVTISKNMTCGLFDHINGAGGPLEIELQRDIYIPPDKTLSIGPDFRESTRDDGYVVHYGVDDTYGLTRKVWETGIYPGKAKLLTEEQMKKAHALCKQIEINWPEPASDPLKYSFAKHFCDYLKSHNESIYEGVRNRGQIDAAVYHALIKTQYDFFDIKQESHFRVGKKELDELMKLCPVKPPKEEVQKMYERIEKNTYMR